MLDLFWHTQVLGDRFYVVFGGGVFPFLYKKGSPKQAAELSVGAQSEAGCNLVGDVSQDIVLKMVQTRFLYLYQDASRSY